MLTVTRHASNFLHQAREKFIQHSEYVQELQNATADMMTLRDYYSSVAMYSMIALSIFPLNMLGIVSVGMQDVTILHVVIAICDSLIILNAYRMWQKLLQIDAVCKGYNTAVQSIQYIEVEPKENQKDG